MKINVKFLGTFHDLGVEKIEIDAPADTDVQKLLEILKNRFGERFSKLAGVLEYLMIFVNDANYRQLQGPKTRLKNGDVVTIGHIAAGGNSLS